MLDKAETTISPPHPAPDFVCIGAQKAGTSWFDTMLRQHRDIFLPPMKEVHFFDFIYVPEHRPWIRTSFNKHLRQHSQRSPAFAAYFDRLVAIPRRQDAWYRAIFDHPDAVGQVTGEVTPAYSLLPTAGVERVRAINPSVKIIFILRDPVDRALSHLRMAANRRKSDHVGNDWLEDGTSLLPAVLARSAYRQNIMRWEEVFPPAQILYLPYGGIRRAPVDFLRQVEAFLGISSNAYSGVSDSVHKTRPVEIDPSIVALLEERLQDDRQYLAERFGADYAA